MNSFRQLLRRPLKTVLGILLVAAGSAVLYICVSQFLMGKETEREVEENYTTVALLTGTYLSQTAEGANGETLYVGYSPSQPPEVTDFLESLEKDPPEWLKAVQKNGWISAYSPQMKVANYRKIVWRNWRYRRGDST